MIRLIHGDCLNELPGVAGVDACVTDPPYELGFMGRAWDQTGIAFRPETWRLVFDAMKPGAHLVAFGGTRTYHRMACAIEDAGFEIRDTLCWLYGTGFPKSLDVSKGIDKAAGVEREVVGVREDYAARANKERIGVAWTGAIDGGFSHPETIGQITAPATPDAIRWQGWGTALKPAFEPIILARKPLIGTVVANVLQHGTGAINIDACRVGTTRGVPASLSTNKSPNGFGPTNNGGSEHDLNPNIGRWPANVLHDGSEEVEAAFAAFGSSQDGVAVGGKGRSSSIFGTKTGGPKGEDQGYGGGGTASRFFYSAKASAKDRAGSKHPTVKPIALMRWLCRLVTPPGGTILDPFAGTGSTGEAAMLEGFNAILIEQDAQHAADIQRRVDIWSGSDAPLFAEVS